MRGAGVQSVVGCDDALDGVRGDEAAGEAVRRAVLYRVVNGPLKGRTVIIVVDVHEVIAADDGVVGVGRVGLKKEVAHAWGGVWNGKTW